MLRGSQLLGRQVIDMEAAERLGRIKEVIVQRDGERVAGFVIAQGESFVGTGGTRRIIPAAALHAIGPDAVTVHLSGNEAQRATGLDDLPRMSDVIGHKMITRSGRLLGSIDDVLIDPANGAIIGFAVGEGVRSKLENILGTQRTRSRGYVRADADLHVGNDLIVVPDDALIEGEPAADEPATAAAGSPSENVGGAPRTWSEQDERESTRRSVWAKPTAAQASSASQPHGQPAAPAAPAEPSRMDVNTPPPPPPFSSGSDA